MPKARPLPHDPVERERLLRRRAQIRRAVTTWRQLHRDKARILGVACMTAHRRRLKTRKAYQVAA